MVQPVLRYSAQWYPQTKAGSVRIELVTHETHEFIVNSATELSSVLYFLAMPTVGYNRQRQALEIGPIERYGPPPQGAGG